MAIPALAILDLVLPGRHGFGAHPAGGLPKQIFLAALRLTQASPPTPTHPPLPGQPAHLSNHHRNTLRQIFQHPAGHNMGSQTEYFDPPPQKTSTPRQ
jgi:hypothetical protein